MRSRASQRNTVMLRCSVIVNPMSDCKNSRYPCTGCAGEVCIPALHFRRSAVSNRPGTLRKRPLTAARGIAEGRRCEQVEDRGPSGPIEEAQEGPAGDPYGVAQDRALV